jgi:outer membrane receptor protein involved in Fe transport
VSGRYNRAAVQIRDQSGVDPALNGNHSFSRFNPGVGFNWNPIKAFNGFIGYNEGNRAPTAVELTCADPLAPCKLPNAFVADPPLQQVVSKTFEMGARGAFATGTSYSIAVFRTQLQNDLQFISTAAVPSAGYFQNVGNTRRQGLEAFLNQTWGRLTLQLRYSYIDATYQSSFAVPSPANSSAVDGLIFVSPGNQIPGIPKNQFKLRADYAFTPSLRGGVNVVAFSSQYARGDENNQDANGPVPGYAVVNLDASWQVTPNIEVYGLVSNLFNKKYSNFGIVGTSYFTGADFGYYANTPGAVPAPSQFQAPGAPLGAWVGVRLSWEPMKRRATP